MALQLLSKINELADKPGCVYDALEPILHSCEAPENTEERLHLSVKLSLCEFEVAGVGYPRECESQSNVRQCARLLETKPTWWTTLSGNYRHISVICQEFRPHFESRRLLSTFKSTVDIVESYQLEIGKIVSTASSEVISVWLKVVSELKEETSTAIEHMRQIREEGREQALDLQRKAEAALDTVIFDAKELNLDIQHMAELVSATERRMWIFSDAMDAIKMDHLQSAEYLRAEIGSSAEMIAQETKKLTAVVDTLKPIANLLRLVLGTLLPLAAFTLAILAVWSFLANCRRRLLKPHPPILTARDVTPDYIFY